MHIVKWIGLLIAIFVGCTKVALAIPLDSWPTWSVAQPYVSKQVPPNAMIVRGSGTNAYYVLEADPTTGALPVNVAGGSITVDIDYQGPPGSPVPTDAAYVGGTDGTNLRGIKTDTSGELQIDVLSSALPSGASTLAAQTTGNNSLASIDAKLSGGISIGGKTYVTSARYTYTSPVNTSDWVQIIASTSAAISQITLFDSSGQTLELGTGAAASETRKLIIPPGGIDGALPFVIPISTRVSIRAVSATASVGELDLTCFN